MEIIQKLTIDLKMFKNNPKTHPKEQIDKIVSSIKTFGFRNPILIDKDNNIIAGHGRLLAAKELDMNQVPCILIEDLTKEQVRAYRLADNRTAESNWDFDMLSTELLDGNLWIFSIESVQRLVSNF